MKKGLFAIGTTLAFLGMASFAVFFMETSLNGTTNLPASGLADIAANIPTAGTPAPDVSVAPTSPPATTPVPTVPADVAAPEPEPITAPSLPATLIPQPAPAPAPLVPPPPAPELPVLALANTSTVATVTITVAPTAQVNTPPPGVEPTSTPNPGALQLPYSESNFTGDSNWHKVWGNMEVTQSGSLNLTAGQGSTGGSVYLKNSESWAGYLFSASVDWISGEKFGLMANYQDANDYILCQYDASSTPGTIVMQLVQHRSGNETSLTPSAAVPRGGVQNINVSIKVTGTTATCSFNGNSISNSGVGPGIHPIESPVRGGVGFSMQDQNPNVSQVIVKGVNAVLEF